MSFVEFFKINYTPIRLLDEEKKFFEKLYSLPSLILKIFESLNEKDRHSCALVCKSWLILNTFPCGPLKGLKDNPSFFERLENSFFPHLNFSLLTLKEIERGNLPFPKEKEESKAPSLGPTEKYFNHTASDPSDEHYLRGLRLFINRSPHYRTLVKEIMQQENRHINTHVPFYHNAALEAFTLSMFTSRLLLTANGKGFEEDPDLNKIGNTHWIRFPTLVNSLDPKTSSELLLTFPITVHEKEANSPDEELVIEKIPSKNDHDPLFQRLAIAVNFHLFGNFGISGEETWDFFKANKSVNPPDFEKFFTMLCDHYKLLPHSKDRKEMKENMFQLYGKLNLAAMEYLKTKQKELCKENNRNFDPDSFKHTGVILQILTPRATVGQCVYPSKAYGVPYQEKTLSTLELFDKAAQKPEDYRILQGRMLTRYLVDFNQEMIVKDFGYGDFFSSTIAKEIYKEIDALFCKILLRTAETR